MLEAEPQRELPKAPLICGRTRHYGRAGQRAEPTLLAGDDERACGSACIVDVAVHVHVVMIENVEHFCSELEGHPFAYGKRFANSEVGVPCPRSLEGVSIGHVRGEGAKRFHAIARYC